VVRGGWDFENTIIEKILSYERNKYSFITILGWHIVVIGFFLPWFVPTNESVESYGYFNDLLLDTHPLWHIAGPLFILTSISVLLSIFKINLYQFLSIFLLISTLICFIWYSQYMLSEGPLPYFIPGANHYVADETTLGVGFYTSVIGIFVALIGPIKTIQEIRGNKISSPKAK
jgi:hypothetical protein